MTGRSVVLLGGPDCGKTNYIGRLWPALDAKTGKLTAAAQPREIGFVLDTADHLFQGHFAPRTEHKDDRRDFEIAISSQPDGRPASIVIPDISGELWRKAVLSSELQANWMSELEGAVGALLFVRVDSNQNVQPLDWVTSRKLLAKIGQSASRDGLPTQVLLCELLRFLELTMAKRASGTRPKLSVVVSAWDRVDAKTFENGPDAYLAKEYPLLAGRLKDTKRFDVKTFGLSIVGGDLKDDPEFRKRFLESGLDGNGWVAVHHSDTRQWQKDLDLTLPVAWAVGV